MFAEGSVPDRFTACTAKEIALAAAAAAAALTRGGCLDSQ